MFQHPPNPNQAESKFEASTTLKFPGSGFTHLAIPVPCLVTERGEGAPQAQDGGHSKPGGWGKPGAPWGPPLQPSVSAVGGGEPENLSVPLSSPSILTSFLPVQGILVSSQPIPRPRHRLCPHPEFR